MLCKATSFSSGLSFKYCRKAFRVSWEARRLKEVGASLRFSALLSAHAGVPYLGAHPRMAIDAKKAHDAARAGVVGATSRMPVLKQQTEAYLEVTPTL